MIIARSVAEMTELRARLDADERTIAFVPTMGALHAGHRSLFTVARSHGQILVVSIFVNPLQFGPHEDYARYPRPLEVDLDACRRAGVDVVFVPTVTDLYPAGRQVSVSAGPMGTILEGVSRPDHFDGMLTVVCKLFNIVRPDSAVFGKKDAQQLACVRRMTLDLNIGVEIVAAPIVRDPDGLALSSRNGYLSVAERSSALALPAALRAASGERSPTEAIAAARAILHAEPAVELDYLSLVHPTTLAEVAGDHVGDALLLAAAKVGGTRLIDNVELRFAPVPEPGVTASTAVAH